MVVLLCLTPLFRNMPQNAQAAIIISAVAGLFNVSEAIFLWKVRTSSHAAGRAQGRPARTKTCSTSTVCCC